ncbi:hypothetical protein [Gordonia hankookensis]|uniref:Uncharacterized protein n=2 Tax=Gordonia hankookensis TaxID=589403 RepID=A0ABR7WCE2_9ACTN|nr:hypothetical protein [Gordonia hankookensis]MBD1320470.1 hypothetical protein [Gordonia hankookensis]
MAYASERRSRHRHDPEGRRSPLLLSVTSAALAASIAAGVGAGLAQAAPEQGGTSPSDTAPQQGGTTPDVPAPEQGGTTPTPQVEPAYTPGPGSIPAPPQEAPYQSYSEPDSGASYENAYTPLPSRPLTAPKLAKPVRPIAPPPKKIRVGNFVSDIPKGMSQKDVNSVNAWSAYGEAKIAQGLISVGVPEDQASRQAASTIIGVMTGGTAGAVTLGIPAAVMGAAGGAVIGTGVGAVAGAVYNGVAFGWLGPLSPQWGVMVGIGTAAGAGIGLAAGGAIGAVGAGAAGAALGAAIGGTAGGALAYALGAGDPGAHPEEPWKQGKPQSPKAKPLPNPGANQFEYKLSAQDAKKSGLPAVNYVVNHRGDVNVEVGNWKANWSVEQALAPYGLMGGEAKQGEKSARDMTKQRSSQIESTVPGGKVDWPQEIAPGH